MTRETLAGVPRRRHPPRRRHRTALGGRLVRPRPVLGRDRAPRPAADGAGADRVSPGAAPRGLPARAHRPQPAVHGRRLAARAAAGAPLGYREIADRAGRALRARRELPRQRAERLLASPRDASGGLRGARACGSTRTCCGRASTACSSPSTGPSSGSASRVASWRPVRLLSATTSTGVGARPSDDSLGGHPGPAQARDRSSLEGRLFGRHADSGRVSGRAALDDQAGPPPHADQPRRGSPRSATRSSTWSRAGIEGDIVECGVWRGGSMMAAALTLLRLGDTDRDLYLFDTFAGMPEPTRSRRATRPTTATRLHERWHAPSGAAAAGPRCPVDDVRASRDGSHRLSRASAIHLVAGMVEDTIPATAPETDRPAAARHRLVRVDQARARAPLPAARPRAAC